MRRSPRYSGGWSIVPAGVRLFPRTSPADAGPHAFRCCRDGGKRQRVPSVAGGAALPKALPEADRALWATALSHAFDAFLARQVG